jgi:hypothetical protein
MVLTYELVRGITGKEGMMHLSGADSCWTVATVGGSSAQVPTASPRIMWCKYDVDGRGVLPQIWEEFVHVVVSRPSTSIPYCPTSLGERLMQTLSPEFMAV